MRGFSTGGDGKFVSRNLDEIIMVNDFANYIPRLWNSTVFVNATLIPQEFSDYVSKTPNLSYEFANAIVATLPGQRYDYYRDSNFEVIKRNVLQVLDKYVEAMGYFNVDSNPSLLMELEPFSYAVMFIGLIFDVLLFIFVVVAILLVFSLLLISVHTK